VSVVEPGVASSRGYYAGVNEDYTVNRALTLETNAIILEALLHEYRKGAAFVEFENAVSTPTMPQLKLAGRE